MKSINEIILFIYSIILREIGEIKVTFCLRAFDTDFNELILRHCSPFPTVVAGCINISFITVVTQMAVNVQFGKTSSTTNVEP